ncbi:hypothetical protein ACFQ9X_39495 [Catenulispora yoronensis]
MGRAAVGGANRKCGRVMSTRAAPSTDGLISSTSETTSKLSRTRPVRSSATSWV